MCTCVCLSKMQNVERNVVQETAILHLSACSQHNLKTNILRFRATLSTTSSDGVCVLVIERVGEGEAASK